MASLIRLKQIESGSSLEQAADIGSDFSASVISIVEGEIVAVLPEGVVSSSVQVDLTNTTNYTTFSSSISIEFSGSNFITNTISSSLNTRVSTLEQFSGSLDDTYATDVEVEYTTSQIIDQGEW